jgi:hypothetical protein
MHPHHVAVLAEPIERPDYMNCAAIQLAIHDVIERRMPRHALSRVKRYLSRQCTKPHEMSVHSYYQHLVFINTQEIPWIPPFGREQAFTDNIIKEILLFATPPEWQRKMDRMGFYPTGHDSLGVLHFMENVEATELPIPVGTGMSDLFSRLNVRPQEAGHRNTDP